MTQFLVFWKQCEKKPEVGWSGSLPWITTNPEGKSVTLHSIYRRGQPACQQPQPPFRLPLTIPPQRGASGVASPTPPDTEAPNSPACKPTLACSAFAAGNAPSPSPDPALPVSFQSWLWSDRATAPLISAFSLLRPRGLVGGGDFPRRAAVFGYSSSAMFGRGLIAVPARCPVWGRGFVA